MKRILVILLLLFGCSPTEPENLAGCMDEDVCLDNECITYDYVEGVNNGKR